MKSAARNEDAERAFSVLRSSFGQKAVAAVSGASIAGWVLLHVAGNLTLLSGSEAANGYAAALRRLGPALWGVRAALLAAVVAHVVATFALWRRARASRSVVHSRREFRGATIASRTMRLSGPLQLCFIGYHVAHLTFGVAHPSFVEGQVYENVVAGLGAPAVAFVYVAGAGLVGLHLFHGLWSVPRTLGLRVVAAKRLDRPLVTMLALAIALGFAMIPTLVVLGVLR